MDYSPSRWMEFLILTATWFAVRVFLVVPHGSWLQRTSILISHLLGALLFASGAMGVQIWIARLKGRSSPR